MKLFFANIFTVCLITFFSSVSFGQQLNGNWETDLNKTLQSFTACTNDCFKYQGLALKSVYKVDDFYSTSKSRYLTTSEIYEYLKGSSKWEKLGPAYDPSALEKAQNYANTKKAAVAIYVGDDGLGHVALIIPGELQSSGSWRVKVPNSASLLVSDPSHSYVGKSLSYAFQRSILKDVEIYGRKY